RGSDLFARFEGETEFQRVPMLPREGESGLEIRLFNLQSNAEYYVTSGGLQSAVYRATVLELPYVERLQVELTFPSYTGLPPETYEDGGDIYAPVGTRVRLKAIPTMPVTGGRVIRDGADPIDLTPAANGTLDGSFTVSGNGLYHIEFTAG